MGSARCEQRIAKKDEQSDDPVLQPQHKIFLSHSGYQKDFAEELCGALESRYRFPFFDRRPSSLPKGERFPQLILTAARQCHLAVVVVSPEYFLSKWCMIELNAFVQTRLEQEEQKMPRQLKILPLFFGLSVAEFGKAERRAEWYRVWEAMARDDARIDVEEWKKCLEALRPFNGEVYHRETMDVYAFRAKVVSSICEVVAADIKWDDSHVRGGSKLCQVIQSRIAEIQSFNPSKACVIGLYGVGGIGKTTTCKMLCNEVLQECEGKVCHVELGSQSLEDSLKKVLKDLCSVNKDVIEGLDESKCWNVLRENMKKQKTFLAIDNVGPDSKSVEVAQKLLRLTFHGDSVVMVTSRFLEKLVSSGVNGGDCLEMPSLEYDDARSLFLYHAAHGAERVPSDVVKDCLALCYFCRKRDTRDGYDWRKDGARDRSFSDPSRHFLPLALKTLGEQLRCVGTNPAKWGEVLWKVRDFNLHEEIENPVFGILGVSFERLSAVDQNVFMDVVRFAPELAVDSMEGSDLVEWLRLVHGEDRVKIEDRLRRLQARGVLEEVDLRSGRVYVHDLYREFAGLKSSGKAADPTGFEMQRWVYYEDTYPAGLEMTPSGRCWQRLTRIAVEGVWGEHGRAGILEEMKWKHYANVVVLKLVRLRELRGNLNLEGLKCLRSLELVEVPDINSLDGLQHLTKLVCFRWWASDGGHSSSADAFSVDRCLEYPRMGQLPSSLEVLGVRVRVVFVPDAFSRCTRLRKLLLYGPSTKDLDLSNCRDLQSLLLSGLMSLKTLSGLTEESTASLRDLQVVFCNELVEIRGLGNMVGLECLCLHNNRRLRKLPDLQKLTRLQVLHITRSMFEELPGLGYLGQLRELIWAHSMSRSEAMKIPDLSGLTRLEVVDFSGNDNLCSLEGTGIGNLPALRCLRLRQCCSLKRVPDMRTSRNLKELEIWGSPIELGEEERALYPVVDPIARFMASHTKW